MNNNYSPNMYVYIYYFAYDDLHLSDLGIIYTNTTLNMYRISGVIFY